MGDIQKKRDVDEGNYSSLLSNAPRAIKQVHSRVYTWRYAGDSAANVNVSETGIIDLEYAGTLARLYIKPDSNVSLNTSNYGFINFGIIANGSLSRTNATLATVNTAAAALTAYTRTNATFASELLRAISANDKLTIITAKPGGVGSTLPAFTVTAVVEEE